MLLKVKIANSEYTNYGAFDIDESLCDPYHIRLMLVPTPSQPLTAINNYLYMGAEIAYEPDDGDLTRFSWVPPFSKYYGYVVREHREIDIDHHLKYILLDIYHPLHIMCRSSHFRIFHEKKLTGIFEEIFKDYKDIWGSYNFISWEFSSDLHNFHIPYCTQYRENDLQFFLRLCESYGIRMTIDDKTLKLDGSMKAVSGDGSFTVPAITKAEISINSQSYSRAVKHRNIECSEPTENLSTETLQVNSSIAMTIEGQDPFWVDTYEPNVNRAKVNIAVNSMRLVSQERVIKIYNKQIHNNQPLCGVRAGDVLNYGDLPYYVHQVKTKSTGLAGSGQTQGYDITIWGREKDTSYAMPARHKKPQIHSFVRAYMIEPKQPSEGDGSGLGRIKVKFLWQEEEAPTCWVRLMMPYAGKTHGFYVMPEIGDEVLVGFEGGDIDRPFCLGSVYNVDTKVLPGFSKAQQMETIHMRTPQDISLKFHEVPDGSQSATMAVTDVSVVSLDNSPSANISTTGIMNVTTKGNYTHQTKADIKIDSGDGGCTIDMKSGGNLSITNKAKGLFASTADQSITAKGQMIKSTATQDIIATGAQKLQSTGGITTVDGAAGVMIDGHSKVDISGTTTTITTKGGATITLSGATITIRGDGAVEVKGSPVNINGGAVNIKGSEIKLN